MSEKWSMMTGYGGKVTFGCVVEYILSALRWFLLIAFVALTGVLYILRIPSEVITNAISVHDNIPLMLVGILGALYVAVLGLSLLCRILRPILGEEAKLRITFLAQLFLNKNYQLIKSLRRIAFWGSIILIVLSLGFGLDCNNVLNTTASPSNIGDYFGGYLAWSLIMLVVTIVLDLLFIIFYVPHVGEEHYSIFTIVGRDISGSFLATFRSLVSWIPVKNAEGKTTTWRLIKFILGRIALVAYIAFVVLGIINIIK